MRNLPYFSFILCYCDVFRFILLVYVFVTSARSFTDAARRYVTDDVTAAGACSFVAEPADYDLSARRSAACQRDQGRS